MKSRHTSCFLYSLFVGLFYFITSSHACTLPHPPGSLVWELNLAKFSTTSAKSSQNTSIALLHSRNERFSFELSWAFSTPISCQVSIVRTRTASSWWASSSRALLSTPILCLVLEENGNLVLKQGNSVLWESHTCGLYVSFLEPLDDGMLILKSKRPTHMVLQRSKSRPIQQLNYPRRAFQEIGPNNLPSNRSGSSNPSNNDNGSSNSSINHNGSSNSSLNYNGSSNSTLNHNAGGHRNKKYLAMEIVFPVAAFLLLAFCLAIVFFRRRKAKSRQIIGASKSKIVEDEILLESLAPGLPPRFTYAEMQEATNGFQNKLGEGGYGAVYEGTLPPSGTKIAVKVFIDTASTACRRGFVAEVMSIGEIKHQNLVQLRGYCVEEDHRMLVYELMENGSLNRSLFGAKAENSKGLQLLSWERRKAIAIDTARALAFLHEEGEQRRSVIHCDVKPENILLNEKWVAKVSDFGLAKLLWTSPHNEEDDGHIDGRQTPSAFDGSSTWDTTRLSSLSGLIASKGVRGTLGYLAPEWVRADAGPDTITTASDVYSFGVVLLELIAGRRSMVPGQPFLLGHAFDMLANGDDLADLIDPYLHTTYLTDASLRILPIDLGDVRNFANVALWCLQEDVTLRPTMAAVLNMLTNKEPISPPPFCDYFAGSSHFFEEGDHHHLHDHLFRSTMSTTHDKGLDTSTTTTSFDNSSWQNSILSGR